MQQTGWLRARTELQNVPDPVVGLYAAITVGETCEGLSNKCPLGLGTQNIALDCSQNLPPHLDNKLNCDSKIALDIQLPRIRHSVRPSVLVLVLVTEMTDLRFANSEDFTFLMPCCIGCSEINKINRHLICSLLPLTSTSPYEKDLSQKQL